MTTKRTYKKRYDFTGQEFPLFRVICDTGKRYRNSPIWLCVCQCNRIFEASTKKIRSGQILSCGCHRKALFTPNSPVSWLQEGTNLFAFMMSKPNKRNTSGVTGVSYIRDRKRWGARLIFKGKLVLNRTCETFDEAVEARRKAEEQYVIPLLEKYNLMPE